MIESRMNPVYAVRKRPRKDIKTEIVSARPKSRVADTQPTKFSTESDPTRSILTSDLFKTRFYVFPPSH